MTGKKVDLQRVPDRDEERRKNNFSASIFVSSPHQGLHSKKIGCHFRAKMGSDGFQIPTPDSSVSLRDHSYNAGGNKQVCENALQQVSIIGNSESPDSASRTFDGLALRLLSLDSKVISATITDTVGQLLSIKYKPFAESLKPTQELLDKAGSLIAVVAALVQLAEAPYGECRYIIFGYGKIKVAVIPVKKKRIVIALGLDPKSETQRICLKALKVGSK
jgi:hypothetical protein